MAERHGNIMSGKLTATDSRKPSLMHCVTKELSNNTRMSPVRPGRSEKATYPKKPTCNGQSVHCS